MTSQYDNLFTIFNDINITMINNNLIIKDKILKKIEMIKVLSNYNIDVLNYNDEKKTNLLTILNSINNKLMSVKKNQTKLNTQLNNILGCVIHNAYISSGYQVLLSNIPNVAKQRINNTIHSVDSETIYDTIMHYIGSDIDDKIENNSILNVVQIDTDKYLAKFKDMNDARYICHLINKMMIEPNIIRVELIENMDNTIDMIDTIDTFLINQIKMNSITKNSNDNTICDYGVGELNNNVLDKSSLYNVCLNLIYEKYSKIKKNIQYLYSFFQKNKK